MEEIWKDIKGYEGVYQVSNLGNVKSVERFVKHSCGGNKVVKEKILKTGKRAGYYSVLLSKEGVHKNFCVHRLVAEAFLDNPNNLPCVNHKDENKTNNYVDNLEWCTSEYNQSYGTKGKRVSIKMTNGKLSKPILQYDLDGNFIKEWISGMEIQRQLGFSRGNISNCCLGRYKQSNGYKWKYKEVG